MYIIELHGRWWNGELSRNTRRDIWLKRDHVWRVEARQGDGHTHAWTHDYPTEEDARAAIAAMIERNRRVRRVAGVRDRAGPGKIQRAGHGPVATGDKGHERAPSGYRSCL
jgi:hypothetical protein